MRHSAKQSSPRGFLLPSRIAASALDLGMCVMMNALQWRHRVGTADRELLERYIAECEQHTRESYFAVPQIGGVAEQKRLESASTETPAGTRGTLAADAPFWKWSSPVATIPLRGRGVDAHCANETVHVDLYPGPKGWSAPTVILLHALMSTSDRGYRAWARRFHARGWNACFVHLPYHYSRTPSGCANGELAFTSDLVRTAEGLRAGVTELRQLMAALRALGTREFGLWGTSYGGWIGALLLSLEADFRWAALMTPILNVDHAIWQCPAGIAVRRGLRSAGIEPALVARHAHLSSPGRGEPLAGIGQRTLFGAGAFDRISPPGDIVDLAGQWGAEVVSVPQGHFGYRLMPAIFDRLVERGWV